MTKDEAAKQRHEMANAMLAVNEGFGPIIDAADGMRADMERRGWSPTAAEQASLAWLVGAVTTAWAGVGK